MALNNNLYSPGLAGTTVNAPPGVAATYKGPGNPGISMGLAGPNMSNVAPPAGGTFGGSFGGLPGGAGAVVGSGGSNSGGSGMDGGDPLSYGGYASGAQDWSQRYIGLGQAAAQYNNAQGTTQQQQFANQGNSLYRADTSLGTGQGILARNLGTQDYAAGNELGGNAFQHATNMGNGLADAARGVGGGNSAYLAGGAATANAQAGAGYGYETQGLGMLANAAAGNGPSAATEQMGANTAAAVRAQLGAAASARGGAYGQAAAQNQAAQQAGAIESSAVGQSAALRAQEQQTAQGQLVGAANNLYGSAAGTGLGYASGASNAAQAGEALAQGSELNTLGVGTSAELAGAQMGQSNQLTAEQLAAQQEMAGQTLGQTGVLTSAQQGLTAKMGYDTLGQQGQLAYEGMGKSINDIALGNAASIYGIDKSVAIQNAALQQQQMGQVIGGIGGAAGGALSAFSDEQLKTDVTPQGGAQPGSELPPPQTSAGGVTPYAASENAGPAQPQGLTKGMLKALGMGLRGMSQGMSAPGMMPAPIARPAQASPAAATAQIAPGTGLYSDERMKTAVEPAPTADALLALLAKSQSTFSYKNPADQPVSAAHPHDPAARFGGVMAQDLERAPEIGRSLVTDTPHGKMLEPNSVMSAALMAIGRLAERVQAIEPQKPRKTGLAAAAREYGNAA